jgi:microcystin-dependent protein
MPWGFYTASGALKNAEYIGSEFGLGTIVDFAGTAAPLGWLFCDGSAVSRTTYAGLFVVVGTAYGTGDGSTTFNLPNATGKIIYAVQGLKLSSPSSATYLTSLPVSPTDGQEIYYAADATNGVIWHLRYRAASSSTYKWEFVGGAPLRTASTSIADENTHGSSSGAAFSNAITRTVPLQGQYRIGVTYHCLVNSRSTNTESIYVWMGVRPQSGSAIIGDDYTSAYIGPTTSYNPTYNAGIRHSANVQTNATLTTQLTLEGIYGALMSAGSGVVRFRYREITAFPLRVTA